MSVATVSWKTSCCLCFFPNLQDFHGLCGRVSNLFDACSSACGFQQACTSYLDTCGSRGAWRCIFVDSVEVRQSHEHKYVNTSKDSTHVYVGMHVCLSVDLYVYVGM